MKVRLFSLLTAAALCAPTVAAAAQPPAELLSALEKCRTMNYRVGIASERGPVTVEFQQADRMHVVAGAGMEMIKIAGDMWVKRGDTWMKLPAMASGHADGMLGGMMGDVHRAIDPAAKGDETTTYTKLADASDGTATAHVWQVKRKDSEPVLFYVRASDGLVHRIDTQSDGKTRTITLDNYGAVRVDPPTT